MKKFFIMVAMMLSMTTATMAHDVRPEIKIVELATAIANDTIKITSNDNKKYELNLNKNFIKIVTILDLDQEQSNILFELQDTMKREFNRLNRMETSKQREERFMKTIYHVYYIIGITFEPKQVKMYKAFLNTTLGYKGYIKYGEFCDLFEPTEDAKTADLSTEELS